MDATNKPLEDDGIIRINRLHPGHVDVVLDSHPGQYRRRPLRPPRDYTLIILCTLLAIMSLGLLASRFVRHAPELFPDKTSEASNVREAALEAPQDQRPVPDTVQD